MYVMRIRRMMRIIRALLTKYPNHHRVIIFMIVRFLIPKIKAKEVTKALFENDTSNWNARSSSGEWTDLEQAQREVSCTT